jgi:sec-independent protein translocase protein TatA
MFDGAFSIWHILIVAAVFVVLFGYKKLPDASRSMARSLRIFKTEMKGFHDDDTGVASSSTPEAQQQIPAPLPAAPVESASPTVTAGERAQNS